MPIKKTILEKKKCLICDKSFRPKTRWQKYDHPRCGKAAFDLRVAEKLRRLEELEKLVAVGQ